MIGTGYVGLVIGVGLSDIGNEVSWVDTSKKQNDNVKKVIDHL